MDLVPTVQIIPCWIKIELPAAPSQLRIYGGRCFSFDCQASSELNVSMPMPRAQLAQSFSLPSFPVGDGRHIQPDVEVGIRAFRERCLKRETRHEGELARERGARDEWLRSQLRLRDCIGGARAIDLSVSKSIRASARTCVCLKPAACRKSRRWRLRMMQRVEVGVRVLFSFLSLAMGSSLSHVPSGFSSVRQRPTYSDESGPQKKRRKHKATARSRIQYLRVLVVYRSISTLVEMLCQLSDGEELD